MATATRPKTVKSRQRQAQPIQVKPATDKAEAEVRPLKIGEAARLLEVEAYVLRFWETQFPFLRPRHTNSSHRMYRPTDLELLRLVKRLLHIEGYTIAGAKKHIQENGLERLCRSGKLLKPAEPESAPPEGNNLARRPDPELRRVISEIRSDLKELCRLLGG
jgi:DNA-binding transcriptional MerR regulator